MLPSGRALMMGLLRLADSPLPKTMREAMPWIFWGTLSFASGFESIVSLKESHYLQALAFLVLCLALAWVGIKWPTIEARIPVGGLGYIPLIEAATRAYEQTRGTDFANMAEAREGGPLRRYMEGVLLNCALRAKHPPSRRMEEIPAEEISNLRTFDDGSVGEISGRKPKYIDVEVRRGDLKAWIKQLKGGK
jgi:hypothetical protein